MTSLAYGSLRERAGRALAVTSIAYGLLRGRAGRALAVGLFLAAACSEPTSGPVRIVWGRHACDHCAMAISEQAFAAEVRTAPREIARFDDFGCAVTWLEAHGGPDAASEFWVRDGARDEWIDGRAAFFRSGQRTPMAYGFAAVGRAEPGALDFAQARRAVLEGGNGR